MERRKAIHTWIAVLMRFRNTFKTRPHQKKPLYNKSSPTLATNTIHASHLWIIFNASLALEQLLLNILVHHGEHKTLSTVAQQTGLQTTAEETHVTFLGHNAFDDLLVRHSGIGLADGFHNTE